MARNPPLARTPLKRDRILASALALIEGEGLAAFSMRGLGASLGCQPMSVYHYFPGKTHLLDALVEAELATVVAGPPAGDPTERLRAWARAYVALARRCPNLYPLIAVHRQDAPAGVRLIEEMLSLVRAVVQDDRLAARFFQALHHYMTGAAARCRQAEDWESGFELGLECLLDAMRATSPAAGTADMATLPAPKPVIHPKR